MTYLNLTNASDESRETAREILGSLYGHAVALARKSNGVEDPTEAQIEKAFWVMVDEMASGRRGERAKDIMLRALAQAV